MTQFSTTQSPSAFLSLYVPHLSNHFFKFQQETCKPVSTFLIFSLPVSSHVSLFVLFPEINHEKQLVRFIFTNQFQFFGSGEEEEYIIPSPSRHQIVSPFYPFQPLLFHSYFLDVLTFFYNINSYLSFSPNHLFQNVFWKNKSSETIEHSFTISPPHPTKSPARTLKFFPLKSISPSQPFDTHVLIPVILTTTNVSISLAPSSFTSTYFEHFSPLPSPQPTLFQKQQPLSKLSPLRPTPKIQKHTSKC